MGFNTLADLQMLGLEYQHTGLAVTQNLIKTQPDLVRNILRGFVEAIHYMKTHRKESLTILAKYLKTDDKDALEEAYESIVQALIPEKPYPTLKGIDIILRELGVKDPNARSAKPEQFVDLTFIKELDSSGFIDRLYKSSAVAKAAPSRAEPLPAPEIAKEKPLRPKPRPRPSQRKKEPNRSPNKFLPRQKSRQPLPSLLSQQGLQPQEYTVKAGDTLSKLSRTLLQLDVQVGKDLRSKQGYSEKPKLHLHRAKTDDTFRRPGQLVFLRSNAQKERAG